MTEQSQRPIHGVDPPMTEPQRRRQRYELERIVAEGTPPTLDMIPAGHEHVWELTITQDMVRLYAEPVEDYNPWYEDGGESPFGFPVVPPLYLSHEARRTTLPLGPMAGRVHTSHDSELLAPVPVGTRLRIRGRVTDKGMKRGLPWLREVAEVTDAETGKLYFRDRREYVLSPRREG